MDVDRTIASRTPAEDSRPLRKPYPEIQPSLPHQDKFLRRYNISSLPACHYEWASCLHAPKSGRGVRHDLAIGLRVVLCTKQMHSFMEGLKENDRVLLVGDTQQHEAVEAGRPYAQLQEAGMRTAHLDKVIRQNDPALKQVVEQLARGISKRPSPIWRARDGCIKSLTAKSA